MGSGGSFLFSLRGNDHLNGGTERRIEDGQVSQGIALVCNGDAEEGQGGGAGDVGEEDSDGPSLTLLPGC